MDPTQPFFHRNILFLTCKIQICLSSHHLKGNMRRIKNITEDPNVDVAFAQTFLQKTEEEDAGPSFLLVFFLPERR
jgi:hypothetical protein